MHHILCGSPFISRDFYAIRPLILWRILASYFLLIWGVGVVRIILTFISELPDSKNFGCLEKGWNRQGVGMQYLPRQPALETCLERPFARSIANKLLHSKQQGKCNSFSTTANDCIAWTIAQTIATDNNNPPLLWTPQCQEPKKNPKAKKSHEQRQCIFWTIWGGYWSLPKASFGPNSAAEPKLGSGHLLRLILAFLF